MLTVLPGTLPEPALARRLADTDAAVVMKLGRNFAKVRARSTQAGRLDRAIYVERGTMADEKVMPLADKTGRRRALFLHGPGAGQGRRP